MSKQYGLILPGNKHEKATPTFQASRNVFGDDSDSDGEQKPTLRPNTHIKRQVKLAREKALSEDPTVYQYDELYDDMEIKKQVQTTASKEEKRPRYIEKLMESANKRKRENERRTERQVQKEREREGGEFADKESFVTSAYKQKLAELRAEEEKEKREEYLESIGDVTKQKDLGGFYRHLYEQKLGAEPKKEKIKTSPKQEPTESDNNKDDETEKHSQRNKTPSSPPRRSRNYRKRKLSADAAGQELSEGEIVSEEEEKVPTLEDIRAIKRARPASVANIDADSDFSAHSTDNEDETHKKMANQKDDKSVDKVKSQDKKDKPQDKKDEQDRKEKSDEKKQQDIKNKSEDKKDQTLDEFKLPATKQPIPNSEPKSPPKPKVDIWKKRTVGVVFEEALKRYYERKAARSQ